jgi:hypothetical protein
MDEYNLPFVKFLHTEYCSPNRSGTHVIFLYEPLFFCMYSVFSKNAMLHLSRQVPFSSAGGNDRSGTCCGTEGF